MFNGLDGIRNDQLGEIQKELHEMNRILRVIAKITYAEEYWRENFDKHEAKQQKK